MKNESKHYQEALLGLMRASDALTIRDAQGCKDHLAKAEHHAGLHLGSLQKSDGESFFTRFNPWLLQMKTMVEKFETLRKAPPPNAPRGGTKIPLNSRGYAQVNSTPGGHHDKSQFDFRPYHALNTSQKGQVGAKFGHRDMEAHEYGFHAGTNDVAHVARKRLSSEQVPKAPHQPTAGYAGKQANATSASPGVPHQPTMGEQASAVAFHQIPGTRVKINSPGHDLHGKQGEIATPNPLMPGKVAVTNRPGQIHHFDPGQLEPTRPLGKSEIVEQSRKALSLIKAGNKKGI